MFDTPVIVHVCGTEVSIPLDIRSGVFIIDLLLFTSVVEESRSMPDNLLRPLNLFLMIFRSRQILRYVFLSSV